MILARRSVLPGHAVVAAIHYDRFTMKDVKDERQTGTAAKNPKKNSRQDRLKLALRENLRRRKSQARGRSDGIAAPSDDADVPLHDDGAKKPDG
jgi:hypothetical protein